MNCNFPLPTQEAGLNTPQEAQNATLGDFTVSIDRNYVFNAGLPRSGSRELIFHFKVFELMRSTEVADVVIHKLDG